jgi:branched-chain amino acid transport system permease protein
MRHLIIPLVLLAWLLLPLVFTTDSTLGLMVFAAINLIQAIGLSLLFGFAGQISLGQAGFFGIGAYVSAIAATRLGVPPLLGMVAATIVPAILAYLVGRPILRLKGYYLAMVTAGLGLIVHTVFVEWESMTGGYSGVANIPPLSIGSFAFDTPRAIYYLASGCAILVFLLAYRMIATSYGRAMRTTRESETAARSVGIDVSRLKAEVFALSAALSGFSGALYAHYVGYISPDTFTIDASINLLLALVVGGINSLWGAAVGAILLTFLPEWLHQLQNAYGIVFGAIVIVLLTIEPGGLIGLAQRLIEGLRARRAQPQPGAA